MNVTPSKIGRPRNQQLRLTALKIARDLAIQQGYRQVSLQAIAAMAHIGRPTIYRWWPNKTALYLDVIKLEFEVKRPHTEVSRADSFKDYLMYTCDVVSGPFGALCIDVLIDVSDQAGLHAAAYHEYILDSRVRMRQLLDVFAKQQTKQFAAPLDVVTDMVIGIIWYRLIHKNGALDGRTAADTYQVVTSLLIEGKT